MKHYLLNHQPQKGLQAACAQQGQAPTCNARGKGRTPASPKTLTRILLVLLTTLLLPSAAWGEGNEYISSTFSGINLGQGVGSGPISYNSATATTSTTDASTPRIMQGSTATGWDVKNLSSYYSICTGANNATSSETNFVFRPINVGQANTITFTLESQFGINGKFVKAEIIYNYSYIKSITANATKNAGSGNISIANSNIPFTCSESGTAEATTGEITANASDYSNMVFANNKIDLSFTVTTAAVQSGIPSFTISEIRLYFEDVTEQPYGIWVNGTSLTGQNINTFLDGKLGYTQPDGNKPAILHLKGTTAIESIYTTLENLEIHLSGENKITPSSQVANGICSSQSREDGTLTFTTEEGGSLTIATGVSVIRGFGKCTGNLETHEPYNITNYLTNGAYYYLSTNSKAPDTTTIKWLKITEAQTYPLWIAGTQVTERNKGNVLGDSKVYFSPADNTTTPATPATLTLDNAILKVSTDGGAAIESTLDNLIVYLVGDNTVQAQAGSQNITSFYAFKGNSKNTITFQTNVQKPGKIQGLVLEQYVFNAVTPAYQEGLGLTRDGDNFEIGAIKYGLTIGETVVTALNADDVLGDGKVSFEPAKVVVDQSSGSNTPATLTLNGATINGPIKSSIDDLRVYLIGSNTMSGISSNSKPFQYTGTETAGSGTLTFETTDAEAGELTMNGIHESGGIGAAITSNYSLNNEFTNSSTISDNWVYFSYYAASETENQKIVIYKNIDYHLTISGQPVGKSNASSILGTTMSFTPADATAETHATLTLNGAKITGGIDWSGSDNLTIALAGENSITNSGGAAINSSAENLDTRPTLTFVKAADATACSLTLTSGTNYINGFSDGSYVKPGSGLFYLVKESSATVTSTLLGGGSGTEADPFLITTADQLKDFSSYVNNRIITTEFVKLANDIDCSSLSDFTPIGTNSNYSFAGTFDGNNKTISGLNCTPSGGDAGLFGSVGNANISSTIIKNLKLDNCTFNGADAGAIAITLNNGIIQGCHVTSSSVTSHQQSPKAGGIVASLGNGSIEGCSVSESTVTGKQENSINNGVSYAGGIAGSTGGGSTNSGSINNCEVTNVNIISSHFGTNGSLGSGGIVGYASSTTITNNTVGGTTTVTCENKNSAVEDYTNAGAIVGYHDHPSGSSGCTFNSNTYESSVKTITKENDNTEETKEGQTQRGIGNESDEIGKIELAGTKSITIGTLVEDIDEVSDYYLSSHNGENGSTTILALPEKNVVITLFSEVENDETVRYTITNASTNGKIEATIDQVTPTDGAPYTKIAFTMPNADVKIDSEILGLGNAGTFGLSDSQPSGTYYNGERSMTLEDGIVGYVITGVSGASVTMTRVSYIPKGVPVYVKMGTSEETPAEEAPASKLKYATETVTGITTESQLFVLYKDKFVKVTSGTDIPAAKCYLDLSSVAAAGTRGFYYIEGGDDGATAIREVRSGEAGSEKTADGGWHDLQGRKLTTKPAKGLYIRNGKKVVVK